MSGIYLVGIEGLSYLKVGVSSDVQQRLGSFQTGLPVSVILHAYERTPYAAELERQLHKRLAQYHVRGEWFDLPLSEALQIFNEFVLMARIDELMNSAEADAVKTRASEREALEIQLRTLRKAGVSRDSAREQLRRAGIEFENALWTRAGQEDTTDEAH